VDRELLQPARVAEARREGAGDARARGADLLKRRRRAEGVGQAAREKRVGGLELAEGRGRLEEGGGEGARQARLAKLQPLQLRGRLEDGSGQSAGDGRLLDVELHLLV